MQEWRLINFGYSDGAMNMAIDEAVSQTMVEGVVPPTLRFYGWRPPCLSLGYAQKASEVEWDVCGSLGVDVVRRPTGGRAILHDQEVTYSVIAPEENPLVSGTILQSYLKLSQGLLRGLRKLGIEAEMVSHKDLDELGTSACFDSPSFYEMVVGGRKTVGSAQTRKNGVLLQHGSIILDIDADMLFSVLSFRNEEVRNRMKQAFRSKACSLQDAAGRKLDYQEVSEAIASGFCEALGITLVEGKLTPAEIALARKLAETKYGSDEWNRKR